jgi:hypothetical protein
VHALKDEAGHFRGRALLTAGVGESVPQLWRFQTSRGRGPSVTLRRGATGGRAAVPVWSITASDGREDSGGRALAGGCSGWPGGKSRPAPERFKGPAGARRILADLLVDYLAVRPTRDALEHERVKLSLSSGGEAVLSTHGACGTRPSVTGPCPCSSSTSWTTRSLC